MLLRQLFDAQTFTFTYIVASDYGKEAIIIDPVDRMVGTYIRLLKELGLTLKYILDTHVHADHITAAGKLRELTGAITVLGAETSSQCVNKKVKDGEKIFIDGLEITAISTPGHTNDSYSFYIPGMLFTGDTLFIRGTGRTDFQSGSASQEYNSIFNKLLIFPDNTIIYPGHDYNGNTTSTIYEEKRFNPRLQVKNVAEYESMMNNLNLPSPKLMDIAVPANLKCGLV